MKKPNSYIINKVYRKPGTDIFKRAKVSGDGKKPVNQTHTINKVNSYSKEELNAMANKAVKLNPHLVPIRFKPMYPVKNYEKSPVQNVPMM